MAECFAQTLHRCAIQLTSAYKRIGLLWTFSQGCGFGTDGFEDSQAFAALTNATALLVSLGIMAEPAHYFSRQALTYASFAIQNESGVLKLELRNWWFRMQLFGQDAFADI